MRKRAAVVALIFLFVWFGSSCAPNDGKLELTKGHDVDFSPLAPLEWGMIQEQALAALSISEEQVEHMEDPYVWMRREDYSGLEGSGGDDALRIREPMQVLGIQAKEVCLQMTDLKGYNEGEPMALLLTDVYVWFPYEDEGDFEAVKKAVSKLYGEPSPMKYQAYQGITGGDEIPVDPKTKAIWYGAKTLSDVLTPESSDYYQSLEARIPLGWGRDDLWKEKISATRLTHVEALYSPDHYFNVGEGGYKKQEPPLIEVRFNGGYA